MAQIPKYQRNLLTGTYPCNSRGNQFDTVQEAINDLAYMWDDCEDTSNHGATWTAVRGTTGTTATEHEGTNAIFIKGDGVQNNPASELIFAQLQDWSHYQKLSVYAAPLNDDATPATSETLIIHIADNSANYREYHLTLSGVADTYLQKECQLNNSGQGDAPDTATADFNWDEVGKVAIYISKNACGVDAAFDYITLTQSTGGWVYVPDGTWSESLRIVGDYIMLFGAGWSSVIDGGTTGHAVHVEGDYCCVKDIQLKTTVNIGNAYDGVYTTGNFTRLLNIFFNGSDSDSIHISGLDPLIANCYLYDPDNYGVNGTNPRIICIGNYIHQVGWTGLRASGVADDSVFVGNIIHTAGDDGIWIDTNGENCVIDGNRITDWTNEAIDDDSGTSTEGDNDKT